MADPSGDEGIHSSPPLLVAQLSSGKSPEEIEATLAGQGLSPRAARDAVEDALSEHVKALRKSVSQDFAIGLLATAFNSGVAFFCLGACFFGAGISTSGRVKLFFGGVFGAFGLLYSVL